MASLPWVLHFFSSRLAVFVEKESSRRILSSTLVVVWLLDTVFFDVRRYLSLSFGFRPLFLLDDDFFP